MTNTTNGAPLIPLVVYKNGQRHVVGSATIENGHISGDINPVLADHLKSIILSGNVGDIAVLTGPGA